MKHILVPIGSSENSKSTLQYAIDFAETVNAKVFAFRAYNAMTKAGTIININEIIRRETNLYMRSMLNSVDRKNIEVKMISAKGDATESIKSIDKEIGIDLIILGPKSNSLKSDVFLGNTSGSIIKHTEIPTLIIPESYTYSRISSALMAFKSGILKKENILNPLKSFNIRVDLLLIKTANFSIKDAVLDSEIENLKSSYTVSENETTFKGVKEHLNTHNTDMLCVFRRKRGFFKKLWEKNIVLKSEFDCDIPLLVLSGEN